MILMDAAQHNTEILDQFTKQAEPFIQRHAHRDDALLALMAECAEERATDALLDIACGPGIVSCFFAKRVKHVTGLDMVPAMLERAQRFQAQEQVPNVDWKLGQSTALPFPDETFDIVVTRFSFHHFLEPEVALGEMKRVCKRGGTVLVADVAPSKEKQDGFNHWEVLRDPSHTRALTGQELETLGEDLGLILRRKEKFSLEMELESLLRGSFPRPGDADRIRALFEKEIQDKTDGLGVAARLEDGVIRLSYPVSVMAWRRKI
jgi:SAM-dependent methyltransferase